VRIYAVTNQKGGSGKTTTAVNLAAALGELGRRVLVVDLDPQGSASKWLGVKDDGARLLDVLTAGAPLADLVCASSAPDVDVVPSGPQMAYAEKRMAGEVGAEVILRGALDGLDVDRWHAVLLDCPPVLGVVTINALAAAAGVLAPVEAHMMAVDGLAALLATVERVRTRINPGLTIAGILPVRVDGRARHSADVVVRLREKFGDLVFKSVVRESVRVAEAWGFAQPVTIYDPKGRGAEDYRAVAEEFLQRESGDNRP